MTSEDGITPGPGQGSIHVVIPIRDMAGHLAPCLASVSSQLRPGDRLTVVDDNSKDDVGSIVASAGADLVRLTAGRGPYWARAVVAQTTEADYLLFVDARCRALPGLIDAHREMLSRPGVALSCTSVRTQSGRSYAAKVAALQQPFALSGKVGTPGRLDFFPTANLGVSARAYRHVGGFRDMRSGADADLCWRVQMSGIGRMAADPEAYMTWVPRETWSGLKEQWRRYGESTAYLERVFPTESPAGAEDGGDLRGLARKLADRVRTTPVRRYPFLVGLLAIHSHFLRSYANAQRAELPHVEPRPFDGLTGRVQNVA